MNKVKHNFSTMKFTFLGTGTSQGVPVIGCRCEVCTSSDSRDHRLRTSALVETASRRILIDAGPDFRYQMLRAEVSRLDAILLTHEHRDHIGGLDDVRALNFVDYPTIRPVDIYATPRTAAAVRKEFDYAFIKDKYRGAPEMTIHEIDPTQTFKVKDVTVTPIRGKHSDRFDITGYRIGGLTYMTDFKTLLDGEIEKLRGTDTLVINALRFEPHYSHFNVEEALAVISEVRPRQAFLTHLSHGIGLHSLSAQRLPDGVKLGYDTLSFEIED